MRKLELIQPISILWSGYDYVGSDMMTNERVKSSQKGKEKEAGTPQRLVWISAWKKGLQRRQVIGVWAKYYQILKPAERWVFYSSAR